MEKESLFSGDISLLYPNADTLRRYAPGESMLSDYDAEQLEFGKLIELKSCHIGEFFTNDPEVIRYRQATFRDMLDNPELSDVLQKMIPLLGDITELRKLESDPSLSADSYLYSITEVERTHYRFDAERILPQLKPAAERTDKTCQRNPQRYAGR